MRKFVAALAAGLLITGSTAGAAFAHHSVSAQFDLKKSVKMQGVLVKLDNINPHAYWHFDVKTPSGKVERWSLEALPPAALRRLGVKIKEDVVVGKTYDFVISPAFKAGTTGLLTFITINGKEYRMTVGV